MTFSRQVKAEIKFRGFEQTVNKPRITDIAFDELNFFLFEQFRQEVPYAAFAVVEEFREQQDPVYIAATVFVERNSQKRIVVGDHGAAGEASHARGAPFPPSVDAALL